MTRRNSRRAAHRVIGVRDLSESAFVLRFSKDGLAFRPGQWLNLGLPRAPDRREYSIYSSPDDPFLEVLVKVIPDGKVSNALRRCRVGDEVAVDGPYGSFCLARNRVSPPSFLFVATGTGISPFHCFVRRYPDLDYLVLHGVRNASELYERDSFATERFVACVSRGVSEESAYAGRVTRYLTQRPVESARYCYLCGNSDMIYETFSLLTTRGVPRSRIFAEIYF